MKDNSKDFFENERPIHDDGTGWNKIEFTILPEHLLLLSEMYVDWVECEFGAPCISCKRPYGNSDVIGDMKDILGSETFEDENGEVHVTSVTANHLRKLHKDTQIVLEICLRTQSFETGTFVCHEYHHDWIKKAK